MGAAMHDDPTVLAHLEAALAAVRQLLDRRRYLRNELEICEIEIREAWRAVPHMPVRKPPSEKVLRAARGDEKLAYILMELLDGSD
jgi:hypothetical protein